MRAILIDPEKRSFEEIDFAHDCDNVQGRIYAWSGCRLPFHGSFEDGFDTLYVIQDRGDPRFWYEIDAKEDSRSSLLTCCGLIFGVDKDGETCDAHISLEELRVRVTFTQRIFRGFKRGAF